MAAAVYWLKNPGSERYTTQLVPALALAAALGAPAAVRVGRVVPALAVVALAASAAQARPAAGPDAFAALARALPAGGSPLVTAAPDAYGVLLPDRSIRVLRPGVRGIVLLDAAARAYEPDLTVRGRLVAKIAVTQPFLRPDGGLDDAPALLYRGVVVKR
jgi:hypothetical protein